MTEYLYTMFRGQRKVLQSLDLELVRIESLSRWLLFIDPKSFGRVASALDH